MTPTDHITNSSSPFPFVLNNEDYDLNHSLVSPNYYQTSSSSSYSSPYQFFFNTTTDQNQSGYYYPDEYYTPPHQPEVDNEGGSYDVEKKNKVGSGLKLTLWKREDKYHENQNEKNPVKWMSSKIKASGQTSMKNTTNNTYIKLKLEDQKKQQPSYPLESTDYSSNSSNNSNNNIPIRVCADCNTTKTPLWRSGPKGPKTLCNACGIRQRKARRAMAAAANGETLTTETSSSSMKKKVKHLHKEKITKVNVTLPYKKRCKFGPSSSSNTAPKKLCNFEDFLINLTNNLALHQIFPQDEKEAAILLMALSSGLVHG
ncbi:PREDICTED: putative GATA transcription factor 22 [Nicotiana attenuata]|uniref:Gata transcription factor 22 n=1 Tax=Nicotiana attenuata TaxID=49451 RepID=A0A1J6I5Z7_NICAT|nr:PREDICTED: putative GATA transcription factor 22 [Nicotiana attenuata]OIS99899.1 putative gata transcription factor 22 [Nicotiana attenuata]